MDCLSDKADSIEIIQVTSEEPTFTPVKTPDVSAVDLSSGVEVDDIREGVDDELVEPKLALSPDRGESLPESTPTCVSDMISIPALDLMGILLLILLITCMPTLLSGHLYQ